MTTAPNPEMRAVVLAEMWAELLTYANSLVVAGEDMRVQLVQALDYIHPTNPLVTNARASMNTWLKAVETRD